LDRRVEMANYSKIIPNDYRLKPNHPNLDSVIQLLKLYVKAESFKYEFYDTPVFVDCGENLKEVACPLCKSKIDIDWWAQQMNEKYDESQFMDLDVLLPCCNRTSSLNDLQYDIECGFAQFAIIIYEPEFPVCLVEVHEVEKSLVCKMRLISARY
jgi:hypothetical protein